ncbi:MAG: methionyl-tRNA formyltransferase [Chloroflexota bacterium]
MSTSAIEPRVVFMGTPEFAVPSLRALSAGPYMLTVVTQPDRPAGRGGKLTPPPVKIAAEELGIPIIQPESLRDTDFRAQFAALHPEVTVLVAYGEYVAPSLLELPRRASINLHPSLLPRWRGSTPIQSAILAGDDITGVSIIQMDRGLDTGPIIAQRTTPIGPEETYPELGARLAQLGADLLAEVLPIWIAGEIEAKPQDEEGVTLTRILTKEDGQIDWTEPTGEIARRVRAFLPWPGTFTHWQERLLKITRARPSDVETNSAPGTVLVAPNDPKKLIVQTGMGSLELLEVQLAGKAPMPIPAFLAGYRQIVGSVLGSPTLDEQPHSV